MAPRNKRVPFHTDATRAKIKAAQLINRLQAHVFNGLKLEMSQIRAIEILLRKCIPDLTSTTITGDITHRYVAELPPMLTREEWERKYGDNTHLDLKAEPPLAIPAPAGTSPNGNGKLQ